MKTVPSGYDEGVDMSAIERLSVVERICRRPGMYVADSGLSGILAWLEGYEEATRLAFRDEPVPDYYDTSPMEVMDAIASAAGINRNGGPVHFNLKEIVDRFGGNDAVITEMMTIAEKNRKTRSRCRDQIQMSAEQAGGDQPATRAGADV